MKLPSDHPLRHQLHDEVHARPPEALAIPSRISYLALLTDTAAREREHSLLRQLAERFGRTPPRPDVNHFSADLGVFRLKWERHTEFTRYKFVVSGEFEDPFEQPALSAVPPGWVESLPGQVILAVHAALKPAQASLQDPESISTRFFAGNPLAGSNIGNGAAIALTDFRIHDDGFSRLLIQDITLTSRQAGRMMQRLLEMETYRILALMALPVARELEPLLMDSEERLVGLTSEMSRAEEQDEPILLDRLTRLSAEIESRLSHTHSRFSAAAAYHELVRRRILELREDRIQGLQTFKEFTERRLAPAMNTCRWIAESQEALSERVARTSQLLTTRVDITREKQNQALLESMDRRASLQLRLQETVEGLSVAAISYYLVGLAGYGAKALKAAGVPLNPDLVIGLSIPFAALAVALGVRKVRHMVKGKHES